MSMHMLKDLLGKSINRHGLRDQVGAVLILEKYKKLVEQFCGAFVAHQINPVSVKNKILTVECFDSMLASELKLKESLILEKLGEEDVERVRYVL